MVFWREKNYRIAGRFDNVQFYLIYFLTSIPSCNLLDGFVVYLWACTQSVCHNMVSVILFHFIFQLRIKLSGYN